jgi:(p)ppGpp synthase/HD superfamily hydrolase
MIIKDPLIDATTLIHQLFATKMDKSGEPYVQHCLRVARRLSPYIRTEVKVVGLLHDTIEDTSHTRPTLAKMFDNWIAYGVSVLSRLDNEPYNEFIDRIIGCESWEIQLVKLCDLYDNTSPYRLSLLDRTHREYFENKYYPAIDKMKNALGSYTNMATAGDIQLPI